LWLARQARRAGASPHASANVPVEFGLATVLDFLQRRTKVLDSQWWSITFRTPPESDIPREREVQEEAADSH
jgi:hypothetical protein